MIRSFNDADTETIFCGRRSKKFPPDIQERAYRKLRMLHAAKDLRDVGAVKGNKLHRLDGNRQGQWSIAINDQWRICFVWEDSGASEVEITDYH